MSKGHAKASYVPILEHLECLRLAAMSCFLTNGHLRATRAVLTPPPLPHERPQHAEVHQGQLQEIRDDGPLDLAGSWPLRLRAQPSADGRLTSGKRRGYTCTIMYIYAACVHILNSVFRYTQLHMHICTHISTDTCTHCV